MIAWVGEHSYWIMFCEVCMGILGCTHTSQGVPETKLIYLHITLAGFSVRRQALIILWYFANSCLHLPTVSWAAETDNKYWLGKTTKSGTNETAWRLSETKTSLLQRQERVRTSEARWGFKRCKGWGEKKGKFTNQTRELKIERNIIKREMCQITS